MTTARFNLHLSLRWLLVIAAPFVAVSIYLCFSRWPVRWFTASTDYAALTIAAASFVYAVSTLPLQKVSRILILVCGIPVVLGALVLFSFIFVGFIFGDWL